MDLRRIAVVVAGLGLCCGVVACAAAPVPAPSAPVEDVPPSPAPAPVTTVPVTAVPVTAVPVTTAPITQAPVVRPPSRSPKPVPGGHAGRPLTTKVTFYAAGDNDPPGSSTIAFPGTRHREAGGTGTFDDPVTLASDPDELRVGAVVYHPGLRKYFVMEDICATCTGWSAGGEPHIDLWTGDYSGSAVTACEHALTPGSAVTVELDPPGGRPVDPTPLFGDGGCAAG